jgi:hypothetical protein
MAMIQPNQAPKKTKTPLTKHLRRTIGASAATLAAMAPVAAAETTVPVSPNNGGVQAVVTTPNPGGAKAPETAGEPSPKQLALNAKAQKAMTRLAHQIVNGRVNEHGGVSYVQDSAGKSMVDSTVTVAATSLYTGMPSEYRFDVVTGVSSSGEPNLDDVRTVSMTEGERAKDSDIVSAPYTSLRLSAAEDTGVVYFDGSYLQPQVDDQYNVAAAVIPANPNVAHLTDARLASVVTQAKKFIGHAIHKDPAAPMKPAFEQPAHTIPRSH